MRSGNEALARTPVISVRFFSTWPHEWRSKRAPSSLPVHLCHQLRKRSLRRNLWLRAETNEPCGQLPDAIGTSARHRGGPDGRGTPVLLALGTCRRSLGTWEGMGGGGDGPSSALVKSCCQQPARTAAFLALALGQPAAPALSPTGRCGRKTKSRKLGRRN